MQKIFEEVLSLDQKCYEKFALSEDLLMEHAAEYLAQTIRKRVKKGGTIVFLCGPGNNGGDGIACARILHKEYSVSIVLPYGAKSKMARLQLKRYELVGGQIYNLVEEAEAYIDALFGSGLSKKLDEKSCELIKYINAQEAIKISCDIPSGIGNNFISDEVFRADMTVSMGALKLPMFEDFAKDFVGDVEVANLGVSRDIYEADSDIYLLGKEDMNLPLRDKKNTNKGSFGHTCVVAGDKSGAAILAGTSALNFGSGLVTLMSRDSLFIPPYLMHSNSIPKNTTSIVIGMGLGDVGVDFELLTTNNCPLVVDADIFYDTNLPELLRGRTDVVLTPHPKEFASLLRICNLGDIEVKDIQSNRFKYVRIFMNHFPDITLVLKGANTIVASKKQMYISIEGTNILSKGGSGDVLSGMIGSLLAQGYSGKDAAITAVLAHSIAANSVQYNNYALNPIDICKEIKCL